MWWELFRQRVAVHPNRVALISGKIRITYAELLKQVNLRSEKLPAPPRNWPGRCLIYKRDPMEVLLQVLACQRRGLVPAVLHAELPRSQLYSAAKFIRPIVAYCDDDRKDFTRFGQPSVRRDIRRSEGLILATSGTMGIPKFVVLPEESQLLNSESIIRTLALNEDDRLLVQLPLSHGYGLVGCCLAGFLAGAELHLFPPGRPGSILLSHIRRYYITVVQGPPTFHQLMFKYWSGQPLKNVRVVTFGGECITRDFTDHLCNMYPRAELQEIYGMSEAGPRISHNPVSDARIADGSVGRPFLHFEWKINPITNSEYLGAGRLMLRGPALFLGYLDEQGSYQGLQDDGFFASQDLVSSDSAGNLYIHGRLDTMFKVGGRLVNPIAIEQVIFKISGVREVHCFGVPHELLGTVARVDVVRETDSGLQIEEIQDACRDALPSFSRPRKINFVDNLPTGTTGKRLRINTYGT